MSDSHARVISAHDLRVGALVQCTKEGGLCDEKERPRGKNIISGPRRHDFRNIRMADIGLAYLKG